MTIASILEMECRARSYVARVFLKLHSMEKTLIFRESLKMSLPLCRLLPRQLHHSISRMTPGFGVSQVRYRSMFDKRTKRTLIELNKRRENVELNQLLKDGKVEHLKRAGEGLFNQKEG